MKSERSEDLKVGLIAGRVYSLETYRITCQKVCQATVIFRLDFHLIDAVPCRSSFTFLLRLVTELIETRTDLETDAVYGDV